MRTHVVIFAAVPAVAAAANLEYGADISFPMQHPSVSTNYPWLEHNKGGPESDIAVAVPEEYEDMPIQPLGDKQSSYEDFMRRCRAFAKEDADKCDSSEDFRVRMNLNQPKSMQNFTETGFMKIRAPDDLMKLITDFFERNEPNKIKEPLKAGQTITNDFDTPTYLVNINNRDLPGGGRAIRNKINDFASVPIREWTGQDLIPTSLYGIRIYQEGAVLTPHVDRLPLISSAIINVAQDVDEPWPLEVISHGGVAKNITMEPGDMVLYESHSIIHGRPFPLKGRYYANIFIHFMPAGEDSDELPIYLIPGSPEAEEWTREVQKNERDENGRTALHAAAEKGYLKSVQRIVSYNKDSIHERDSNGWQPIHEAARAGNVDVVRFLLDHGADINSVTLGTEGTPLYFAIKEWGESHPLVRLLEDRGGVLAPMPRKLTVDESMRSDLHTAAATGDMKTLRELVPAHKADVDAEDKNGWRPLHEASRLGYAEAARYLLDNGADVNARTWNGQGGTPLYYALTRHSHDHPVVKVLKEWGAVSAEPTIDASPKSRKLEVDESLRSALHTSAGTGDMETLRNLVPAYLDEVNSEDEHGWRPLHEASRSGHADAARYLLDNGADVNARTWQGQGGTPLYFALSRHNHDHPIVKVLKERGAVSVEPNVDVSLKPRKLKVDESLRSALHTAAADGDMKTLQELVPVHVAEINDEDEYGWRPLHEASRSGHAEAARYLLDNGADVNAQTWNGRGYTPLYLALSRHSQDHPVVKLLKERGAVSVEPVL